MAEIVFISPYQELTNTVNRVIEKYQITNMEVLEGNLDQGLILAQKAVNDGATIVISRRYLQIIKVSVDRTGIEADYLRYRKQHRDACELERRYRNHGLR
jgi:hypothetical protein